MELNLLPRPRPNEKAGPIPCRFTSYIIPEPQPPIDLCFSRPAIVILCFFGNCGQSISASAVSDGLYKGGLNDKTKKRSKEEKCIVMKGVIHNNGNICTNRD